MDFTRIHSGMTSGLDSNELSFVEFFLAHTDTDDMNQFTGLSFQTNLANNANIRNASFQMHCPELDEKRLSQIHSIEKEALEEQKINQTTCTILENSRNL